MKLSGLKKLSGLLAAALLLAAPVFDLSAQESGRVSGSVTDETGGPLPGVVVMVKGTTNGTTTDQNGEFSFSIPQGGQILFLNFHAWEWRQSKYLSAKGLFSMSPCTHHLSDLMKQSR